MAILNLKSKLVISIFRQEVTFAQAISIESNNKKIDQKISYTFP
jgi:hypothetical protein